MGCGLRALDPPSQHFYKAPLRVSCMRGEVKVVSAEWQSGDAADCKSVYVGSIPASASKYWSGVAQW